MEKNSSASSSNSSNSSNSASSSNSSNSSIRNTTTLEENYTYNIYHEVNFDQDIDRSIPNLDQDTSIPFIRRMTSKDRL